jgi:nicotinate-nucleotide adenylyltransferase
MALQRIGIYGGTFDPIHHGHLILAREAIEVLALEKVLFVPAAISPHKLHTSPGSTAARLEMLRAALSDEPGFELNDMELSRPGPSFSFDTVRQLLREQPEADFHFLIGEDNVAELETWHRFSELREMVTFVVLDRGGSLSAHLYPTIRRQVDISATDIRKRVASGRSIRYLVPAAVEEIIRREKLYLESPESHPKN